MNSICYFFRKNSWSFANKIQRIIQNCCSDCVTGVKLCPGVEHRGIPSMNMKVWQEGKLGLCHLWAVYILSEQKGILSNLSELPGCNCIKTVAALHTTFLLQFPCTYMFFLYLLKLFSGPHMMWYHRTSQHRALFCHRPGSSRVLKVSS